MHRRDRPFCWFSYGLGRVSRLPVWAGHDIVKTRLIASPAEWIQVFLPDEPAFNRQEDGVKNIFVGNLDFHATEESLRSLFERYGTVNSARIMTDRDTGRSRGFAFVEMANEGEADQAIAALNGYTLDGRALNVNEARPKPERSFGQGGGGGRGFGGRGGRGNREPRY